jgi:alpha-beta hydrolase superfamily lysophospholipase
LTAPTDWRVAGAGGRDLGGLRWDAPSPRAAVYIAHGLAEHVARYDRFAQALNDAGMAVAGHDHRGHRLSVESAAEPGHVADGGGFALMAADLKAGVEAWRNAHAGLPLVLFGHSMGSFLVQKLLTGGGGGIDMAILSGSNGPPAPLAAAGRLVARIERLRLGRRGRSGLLHRLAFDAFNRPFEPAPTKLEWLSRDRAEVDAYIADPFCGFTASTASWIALLDRPEALRGLRADLPVLLAAGDRDPVGDMGRGVRRLHDLYRNAGVSDLTLTLYPGARHEILNETNRDAVAADIIGWIGARLDRRETSG